MSMVDMLTNRLKKHGWLSITSLYFDNAYAINIFNTFGFVAYSAADECFFSVNCLDTTDTEIIENRLVTLNPGKIGQQQVVTCVGLEHFQHFDMATFGHYRFLAAPVNGCIPYPDIPSPDDIMAYGVNPDTGLVDGVDEVTTMAMTKRSTLSLYDKFYDYKNDDFYSGINIAEWQYWYTNHDAFLKMLTDGYGVTNPI